jgi:hypothetical protein
LYTLPGLGLCDRIVNRDINRNFDIAFQNKIKKLNLSVGEVFDIKSTCFDAKTQN